MKSPSTSGRRPTSASKTTRCAPRLAAADKNLEHARRARTHRRAPQSRAVELLERLPQSPERTNPRIRADTRLVLLMQRRHGLTAPQFREALKRMDGAVIGEEEPPELVGARLRKWGFNVVSGNLPDARAIADDMLAHAARTNDDGYLLAASIAMGNTLHHLGDHAGSLAHIERACRPCARQHRLPQPLRSQRVSRGPKHSPRRPI